MKFLRVFFQDIREKKNIDIYLTFLLAIVVAILSFFQVTNQSIISGAVLATLALVSYSLLVNRREDTALRKVLSNPVRLFIPRSDVKQLIDLIPQSTRIWAWGTTFSTHIPLIEGQLRQAIITSNLNVRFLLIKPNSGAVKMATFRAGYLDDSKLNTTLVQNLSTLEDLRKEVTSKKLDFKVADYLGPYTIYIFDPHLESGQIHLHLSTFRGKDIFDRPTFVFTREESTRWFDYFVEQYERIWSEAELYGTGVDES